MVTMCTPTSASRSSVMTGAFLSGAGRAPIGGPPYVLPFRTCGVDELRKDSSGGMAMNVDLNGEDTEKKARELRPAGALAGGGSGAASATWAAPATNDAGYGGAGVAGGGDME